MTAARDPDPAMGLRFEVQIDGQDLGFFTGCEGLGAEYEVFEWTEGGNNAYVHKLPGRLKFTPIKLSRPVDKTTKGIAQWFARLQTSVQRSTGTIIVYDGNGKEINRWSLLGVYPIRWTGPSLSTDGNQVAKETLELVHNGFMGGGA